MLFVVLVAIFANVLAPYDPLRSNFRARLRAPNAEHWFGTDHFGRDLLSRVIYGGRVSLDDRLLRGGGHRHRWAPRSARSPAISAGSTIR